MKIVYKDISEKYCKKYFSTRRRKKIIIERYSPMKAANLFGAAPIGFGLIWKILWIRKMEIFLRGESWGFHIRREKSSIKNNNIKIDNLLKNRVIKIKIKLRKATERTICSFTVVKEIGQVYFMDDSIPW